MILKSKLIEQLTSHLITNIRLTVILLHWNLEKILMDLKKI